LHPNDRDHSPPLPAVAGVRKVRVALGIKRLAWRSVEIPRLPPKPDVMPLTGGYRRTPVMQIGADIYCDSQCILRNCSGASPFRRFFPGCRRHTVGLNRWADGLFDLAVRLSLARTRISCRRRSPQTGCVCSSDRMAI